MRASRTDPKSAPHTQLHIAAAYGRADDAQALIETKADINTLNCYFLTPLQEAARSGATDVVKVLLNAKADPTLKHENGQTALELAQYVEYYDVVKLLEEAELQAAESEAAAERAEMLAPGTEGETKQAEEDDDPLPSTHVLSQTVFSQPALVEREVFACGRAPTG